MTQSISCLESRLVQFPIMLKGMTDQKTKFFSIMVKVMTERETREYHMHRLYELSLKSRAKEMR